MKKNTLIFNLLGVILCGLTTQATADFCGQNYNDCCEWSVLDGKVTLGADYLYWKVQQDGITPGTIISLDPTVTPSITTANRVRPNFKYDSGYRVNLGYELPCDCWDVNVCYTYMPSNASTTSFFSASELEFFAPAEGSFLSTNFNSFASKWDFTGNNVDLDIGRSVCFGECLKIRPHIGFRASWWDQKYRSLSTFTPIEVAPTLSSVLLKEQFQGYGIEGGLWSDWKLGYGISLVGHVGGSILYSRYKVHGRAISGVAGIDGEIIATTEIVGTDTVHTGTPTVDYFIGLQYGDTFCDMLFNFHVGWEQHVFFDTNKFLSTGNLSAQGLTLGLEVGF